MGILMFFSLGGDQLRLRLHIKEVIESDYRGSYECWMANRFFANKTLVRFKPGNHILCTYMAAYFLL